MVLTGWTVIDEFCARFVYSIPAIGALLTSSRCRIGAGRARVGACGLALWALVNGGLVASGFSEWPIVSLALALPAPGRHHRHGHAVSARAVAQLPALLRRAFHRHLPRLLPADGDDADLAVRSGLALDIGMVSLDRDHCRRRRRAFDLAHRAGTHANFLFERPDAFWIAPKKAGRGCKRRGSSIVVPAHAGTIAAAQRGYIASPRPIQNYSPGLWVPCVRWDDDNGCVANPKIARRAVNPAQKSLTFGHA